MKTTSLLNYDALKEEHVDALLENNIHLINESFSIYKFPVHALGLNIKRPELAFPSRVTGQSVTPDDWPWQRFGELDKVIAQLNENARGYFKQKGYSLASLAGLALTSPDVEYMQTHMHFAAVTKNMTRCVTFAINYGLAEVNVEIFDSIPQEHTADYGLLDNANLRRYMEEYDLMEPHIQHKIPGRENGMSVMTAFEFDSSVTPHRMRQKDAYCMFLTVDGVE